MSAPEREDLERRLTELFQQRAATVTGYRAVQVDSAQDSETGPKPVRFSKHRHNLGVLVAAAAVFVAVAGTILGIQAGRHESESAPPANTGSPVPSAPTATATTAAPDKACVVAAPASWRQAIASGAIPVDRSLNDVVSANGVTGDYLAVQGNQPPPQTQAIYTDVELALFHGSTGKAIYTPAADSTDIPKADPSGAITAGWVAFAVAHPQSLDGSYKVMLYDRTSGHTITLAEVSEQEYLKGRAFIGSPVIVGGKVYWLTTLFSQPGTTTLSSWDIARGTVGGSIPAPNATELIYYGSGVALGGTVDSGLPVRNGAGTPLSSAERAAAFAGTNFGFDGIKTLSWWQHEGLLIRFVSLQLDSHVLDPQPLLHAYAGVGAAVKPLVEAEVNDKPNSLLDLRSDAFVIPPDGVTLKAVVGNTILFGTSAEKGGAAGLSAVALSALPPVHC
jgi:hypothetical protein